MTIKDKSRAELFEIARDGLGHTNDATETLQAENALAELERRTAIDIVERLERVCEDVAAFKKAHATGAHAPAPAQIGDMRHTAEQRAWAVISEWINKAGTYACAAEPPNEEHNTWIVYLMHGTLDDRACTKEGTSRLDALAHLAAWCQEEMNPVRTVDVLDLEGLDR